MKILIIMSGFFPGKKYGGPPVSVDNFCSLMMNDECYIVTHDHDMGEKIAYPNITNNVWIDRDNCKVMYLSDEKYCKKTFLNIIKELRPDRFYLQGLFQSCILPCLLIAKKMDIKVVLAPRGELCVGALKKKYKKLPYIAFLRINGLLKNVIYQSTSAEETDAIIKYLGVKAETINFLTNIPSIPSQNFNRKTKEVGQAKFVFLSRIHPKKNLLSAINYFQKVEGDVIFDIYGSLEDESYWKECQKAIKNLPDNVSVNYCGLLSHDEVHSVFSKYNAFLFPTFSENYGHVIAESLSVGTPVIISNQTPWNGVNEAKAGWAFPLEDVENFVKVIQNIINWNKEDNENYCRNAQQFFLNEVKLDKIRNEYETVFKGQDRKGDK